MPHPGVYTTNTTSMKRIARTVLLLISILTFAACEGDNPYSSYHANVIFDGPIQPGA